LKALEIEINGGVSNKFILLNKLMDPSIWGPKFWFSLHSVSLTYPFYPDEKDKENYKQFYYLLQYVLPCVVCRVNYKKNISQYPIDNFLKDRKSLVRWVIDVHNMVNVETGKKVISFDEAIINFERIYGKKIYLEDPEPEVTGGKKLDDETWRKNNENKKWQGRFKNNVMPILLPVLIILLLIILLVLSFVFNK